MSAWAQFAFTTQAVNIRAGPDHTFPMVAWLPAGATVNVLGRIDGWRWCDVAAGFNRGWVFGQFLAISYQSQPIVIMNSGGWLGVPLITFSIGSYWDLHYRNRPWWNQRSYWVNRPPPAWRPPPSRPPGWRPPPVPGSLAARYFAVPARGATSRGTGTAARAAGAELPRPTPSPSSMRSII